MPAERERRLRRIGPVEEDGDELRIVSIGLIDDVSDDRAFPLHAAAYAGCGMTEESGCIVFRDDTEDETGAGDFVQHPDIPSLRGEGRELIDPGVDTVLA